MHILLHSLTQLVRAHCLQDKELHEGAPRSADVRFIRREEVIGEDLALVEPAPACSVFSEVLHERVEEGVTVGVRAQLIPDFIWEPILARVIVVGQWVL